MLGFILCQFIHNPVCFHTYFLPNLYVSIFLLYSISFLHFNLQNIHIFFIVFSVFNVRWLSWGTGYQKPYVGFFFHIFQNYLFIGTLFCGVHSENIRLLFFLSTFFFSVYKFAFFNTIALQNCRKVTLSMSVTICADATNSVQTEYYRTEYESNWKSLKQRKRSLFFWLTWIFLKACRIDFYGDL